MIGMSSNYSTSSLDGTGTFIGSAPIATYGSSGGGNGTVAQYTVSSITDGSHYHTATYTLPSGYPNAALAYPSPYIITFGQRQERHSQPPQHLLKALPAKSTDP